MVAVILAARPELRSLSPVARLAAEVAIGAAIYLAGARLIFRGAAVEFVELIRASILRRR
jgi:hypothetical protein